MKEIMTVRKMLELVALRDDAPPQLRFWLQHVPGDSSWLEAPRPDWLAYLARVAGVRPELCARLNVIARMSLDTPRRRSTKIDPDPTAAFAPLLDGADQARGVLRSEP